MKKGVRLPSVDVIRFEITRVLKKHKSVGSQKRLASLVNGNLKKVEPSFSVSDKRIRSITFRMPEVKVSISTRKGKLSSKCPSCGGRLKKSYTRNLKGKRIVYRISCQKCGFSAKNGRWNPKRYSFSMK